jgi:hypothetical protein
VTRYDTEYQAFRRAELHKLKNMDPDDIVCELKLETEDIIDKFWETVETYIEENYYGEEEDSDEEDE